MVEGREQKEGSIKRRNKSADHSPCKSGGITCRTGGLERGSDEQEAVERLVRKDGDDAGDWESYKLRHTKRRTRSKRRVDNDAKETIRKQTITLSVTQETGRNIYYDKIEDPEKIVKAYSKKGSPTTENDIIRAIKIGADVAREVTRNLKEEIDNNLLQNYYFDLGEIKDNQLYT